MPPWYPSWTNCTNASGWYSYTTALWYGGLTALAGLFAGGAFAILGAVAPGVGIFFAGLCMAGILFCNWWLNNRLICLGGDRSAIGAIFNTEPPTPSYGAWNLGDYDTDYSFNLLIYPAIPIDALPNWFAGDFSPPQTWEQSAINQLQSDWTTLFPFINIDDAQLILPQMGPMGSLGLGFTGQFAWPAGTESTTVPFISITISPSGQSITNGSTLQLRVTGHRSDGTYQDLTQVAGAVNWIASSPTVTISTGGLVTAGSTQVGTVIVTAELATNNSVSGAGTVTVIAGAKLSAGPTEQMLIHCEIEGPGMVYFRDLLYGMMATFLAAAAFAAFPPWGTIVAAILAFLAWLAFLFGGPAIQADTANPPGTPSGGYAYADAPFSDSPIDLVYVYGRWVFDSLHQPAGSNELHPLHFVVKIGTTTMSGLTSGDWGIDLGSMKTSLDQKYGLINSPTTLNIQSAPSLQFTLHPLLDG